MAEAPPDIVTSCQESLNNTDAVNDTSTTRSQGQLSSHTDNASEDFLPDLEKDIQLQIIQQCCYLEKTLEAQDVEESKVFIELKTLEGLLEECDDINMSLSSLESMLLKYVHVACSSNKYSAGLNKLFDILKQIMVIDFNAMLGITTDELFINWIETILLSEFNCEIKESVVNFLEQIFENLKRGEFVKRLDQTKQIGKFIGTLIVVFKQDTTENETDTAQLNVLSPVAQIVLQCIMHCRPSVAFKLLNEKTCQLWADVLKNLAESDNCSETEEAEIISRLGMIQSLVPDPDNMQMLINMDTHENVVKVTRKFHDNRIILKQSIQILFDFCADEELVRNLRDLDVIEILHSYLSTILESQDNGDSDLVCTSLQLYTLLLQPVDTDPNHTLAFLKIVHSILCTFREDSRIQNSSLQALMATLNQSLYLNVFGDSPSQIAIHTVTLGVLLMHGKTPQLFCSICCFLHSLFRMPAIASALGSRNIHIAIIACMKSLPPNDTLFQCLGYRALNTLCEESPNNAHKLARYGILGDICEVFEQSYEFKYFQEGLLRIITTLCLNQDAVISSVLLEKLSAHIQNALLDNEDNDMGSLVCLEALEAVIWKSSNAMMEYGRIWSSDPSVVGLVLSCMGNFEKNSLIQSKGLRLLQYLLSTSQVEASSVLCQHVIRRIESAFEEHPGNQQLLQEGFVLVYLLAKHSSFLSQLIIQSQIMDNLLKQKNNYEVENYVDICLYILAVHRNLKTPILLYACSRNYAVAAACMVELGADINTGLTTDTPLGHACRHQNIPLIQMLLSKQVTDVNVAMKVALGMKNNEIIGLLLKHSNKNRTNGSINCSYLDLPDLENEWLIPVLTEHPDEQTTESGRSTTLHIRGQAMVKGITAAGQVFKNGIQSVVRYHSLPGTSADPKLSTLKETPTDATHPDMEEEFAASEAQGQLVKSREKANEWSPNKGLKRSVSLHTARPSLRKPNNIESEREQERKRLYFEDPRLWGMWNDMQRIASETDVFASQENRTGRTGLLTIEEDYFPISDIDISQNRKLSGDFSPRSPSPWSPNIYNKRPHIGDDKMSLSTSMSTSFSGSVELSSSDTQTDGTLIRTQNYMVQHQYPVITALDLSNNCIKQITAMVSIAIQHPKALEHIQRLTIACNAIETFPNDLPQYLCKLVHLDLSSNHLVVFPSCVMACPNLVRLDVSKNQIQDCSVRADTNNFDMPGMQSLEELHMTENLIDTFPVELCSSFASIILLDLSYNTIKDLPQDVKIPTLQELVLVRNHIKTVPGDTLLGCPQIKKLILECNSIENLPNDMVAKKLLELEQLNLNSNKLSASAEAACLLFITSLPRLKVLKVNDNALETFPHAYKFKSLVLSEIHAAYNRIRRFPIGSHAGVYSHLKELNLRNNILVEIPRELGEITSLTSLNIGHNPRLTSLPDELGNLNRLWDLNIDGLRLDMDEYILSGRTRDFVSYLHEKLKRSVEYNYLKLMVVGYGGRGKTTLIHSLMKHRNPDNILPTVGIDVKTWRFMGTRNNKLMTYTLSVWDFAGQEDFYVSHQCFLSKRAMYMVVYNASLGVKEIEKLRPWLQTIHARAPLCPVIIVGTHIDKVKADERPQLIQMLRGHIQKLEESPGYPRIKGMAEVDCVSASYGMEKTRILVKDILDDYKVKGQSIIFQKVPASYVRLQDLLSRELNNLSPAFPVVNRQKILNIVRKGKLDLDTAELNQAIRFLHNSGVIFNYEDASSKLNDFFFLDPQWLCRMMAQVVTVREINPFISPNGVLRQKDVQLLFSGKRVGDKNYIFPPNLIPQYLKLLEKFEVALQINDTELIIPSKLPEAKPAIELPVKAQESLVRRIYMMLYLPVGLWSRLIARLLTFISTMLENLEPEVKYWRQGMYIFYTEHAFIVIEPLREPETGLVITVPPSKNGTRLLSHAADHVDSLIEEWYPGLLEISPTGLPHLHVQVPCIECTHGDTFYFSLNDLIEKASTDDFVTCPNHENRVPLRLLAPDVLLADIDESLHIEDEHLQLLQQADTLLGDGSFGKVYKANYLSHNVAAKLFLQGSETPVYRRMRQEVQILRRLKHPCLIKLLGVDVKLSLIILELAPQGSLRTFFHNQTQMHRLLKHRVALQIAEGLRHLHKCNIIYRDMKPDNILIFSLQTGSGVNVKISDYGIARLTTPTGLYSSEGTPGYRAPEVIKGEPYSVQADAFSYGVLLYELLTNGVHPYAKTETGHRIDERILSGAPPPPVETCGTFFWHEMEDLIGQCLRWSPDDRPKLADAVTRLSDVTSVCHRQVFRLGKGCAAEIILKFRLGDDNKIVTSSTNDLSENSQLSLISPSSQLKVKGALFTEGKVLCMTQLTTKYLLVGTERQNIYLLRFPSFSVVGQTIPLVDSVLWLLRCRGNDFDNVVAGTAEGGLYIFNTQQLLLQMENNIMMEQGSNVYDRLQLGSSTDALKCCRRFSTSRLFVGVGTAVFQVQLHPKVETMKAFDTVQGGDDGIVNHILRTRGCLHIVKRWSSVIQKWSIRNPHKYLSSFDAENFLTRWGINVEHSYDCRILSACIVHKEMWLGLADGNICVIDAQNYTGLTIVESKLVDLKCSLPFNLSGEDVVIFSGSTRKAKTWIDGDHDPDERNSCLLVWDADLSTQHRVLNEYLQKFQALKDQMDK